MTTMIGDTLYLQPEKDQQCDLCGKIAELRPYGPNGEKVCFSCGMKNPKAAFEALEKIVNSSSRIVIVPDEDVKLPVELEHEADN